MEAANPSSEKMTTIAQVIGLKGMPMGKTLVGSFSQPRDHRLPRKGKKKEVTQNTVPLHFILVNCKYKDNPEFRFKTNHFH